MGLYVPSPYLVVFLGAEGQLGGAQGHGFGHFGAVVRQVLLLGDQDDIAGETLLAQRLGAAVAAGARADDDDRVGVGAVAPAQRFGRRPLAAADRQRHLHLARRHLHAHRVGRDRIQRRKLLDITCSFYMTSCKCFR